MTDTMIDYILANLEHEPGCKSNPKWVQMQDVGWTLDIEERPCACRRAEAVAWLERQEEDAMEAKHALRRILESTPHSMCADAGAWAVAEQIVARLECDHDWVDARSAAITDGEWCRKCNAVRAAGG